ARHNTRADKSPRRDGELRRKPVFRSSAWKLPNANCQFPFVAKNRKSEIENRKSHPSSQNLSLKYLSPESQRMVTNTAGSSFFNFWATCRQPTTAAAAEIPTSNPSSRANRLAIA